jgi:hypothetical protein
MQADQAVTVNGALTIELAVEVVDQAVLAAAEKPLIQVPAEQVPQ